MSFSANTPVSLTDCVFVIGLPISEDEYRRAAIQGEFTQEYRSWRTYHERIVTIFDKSIAPLGDLGLSVYTCADVESLHDVFRSGHKIVVLLSHWNNETIEMGGTMVRAEEVAGQIPSDYLGLIDIGACRAHSLADCVKDQATGARVISRGRNLSARAWLLFYGYVFHGLTGRQVSYVQCLQESLVAFRKVAYQ